MTATEVRTKLTPKQLTLIRASATLRAWGDCLQMELEGKVEVEGKEDLIKDLKRVSSELWKLAD